MNNSELTVYKNELNSVPFRKFKSIEMDLFFAICTKMKNKELDEVIFSFENLKRLSSYKDRHFERFISDLKRTYNKMLDLKYSTRYINKQGEDIESHFVLFTGFKINRTQEYIKIKINSDLKYILNEISGEFTKFELEEFTKLRSSYSKTAFRLLKQFRQTGFWKIKIEDFRELFDIPKSYQMNKLTKTVLEPIENELCILFKNFKIKKIKAKKQNKIEYIQFTFKPQDDIRKDGKKIFKDEDGKYYENDIEHFTKEEVNKSFPN